MLATGFPKVELIVRIFSELSVFKDPAEQAALDAGDPDSPDSKRVARRC